MLHILYREKAFELGCLGFLQIRSERAHTI